MRAWVRLSPGSAPQATIAARTPALHRLIAAKLRQHPELLAAAQANLDRW